MEVKIALIGAGTVGQGFLAALRKKKEQLFSRYGISINLVAVCSRSAGSILAPAGLKITEILPLLEDGTGLQDFQPKDLTCVKGLDANATIDLSHADVVIEATPTDFETGEPATTIIRKALSLRKHVVTTNKGPVTLHYQELLQLARHHGVRFLFGGIVMSGTPLIDLLTRAFRADEVLEVRGSLNVSTNFILYSMEHGKSFEEAQKEARERGYLEADAEMDLEGFDPVAKLIILVNILTGGALKPDQIKREGIHNITSREIQAALDKQIHFRMISHAWRNDDGSWSGQVGPCKVGPKDPFYELQETWNAIQIRSEMLGGLFLAGPGTGRLEMGNALLTDILSIYLPS